MVDMVSKQQTIQMSCYLLTANACHTVLFAIDGRMFYIKMDLSCFLENIRILDKLLH